MRMRYELQWKGPGSQCWLTGRVDVAILMCRNDVATSVVPKVLGWYSMDIGVKSV